MHSHCLMKKSPLQRVGRWGRGPQQRVVSGMDGLGRRVVMGAGRVVVPVDLARRWPEPPGLGGPCREKLTWARLRLDARLAAWRRHGVAWPPPRVGAERWWRDSQRMPPVHKAHQGAVLVEGQAAYGGPWAAGRQGKGPAR